MSDNQPFLDAIIATPKDDTPRLIYADWLDDHGDTARAEFIRVQCELAKIPRVCLESSRDSFQGAKELYAKLSRRQDELWKENKNKWFEGADYYNASVYDSPSSDRTPVTRGFISRVRCSLSRWCGGPCDICKGTGGHMGSEYREFSGRRDRWISCLSCGGSGTLKGDAGEICLRNPIWKVELLGMIPAPVFGNDNDDMEITGCMWTTWQSPETVWSLPAELWNVLFMNRVLTGSLEAFPVVTEVTETRIVYASEESAFADLSQAALRLGKERARKLRGS